MKPSNQPTSQKMLASPKRREYQSFSLLHGWLDRWAAYRLGSSGFGVLEGEEEKREMCRWRMGNYSKPTEERAAE